MRFWVFGLCTHGAILTPNVEHFWQNIVLRNDALIALQLIQVFSCFSIILLLIDLLQKSFCNFFLHWKSDTRLITNKSVVLI